MPRSILVIDDEKDILKLLQYNLEKEGYQVRTARSGEEGFEAARAKKPDAVILDLMLPGIDGLEVCRLLRADKSTKNVPIVMLTAKGSEVDQVVGLELGASDYVSKPFSVKVLLARLKNVLRAQETRPDEGTVLRAGDAVLDRDRQSFTIKGKPVPLTKLEFRILGFLMENRGKVFSRDKLLSGAWEGEAFVVDRTVDVHVRSIRRKLGKHRDYIETVRGTGYRFAEVEPA
ncbi:MAG TPA: response regulator transcription factor [Candidatus Eisenbacteria bacterium]|nr:response regulator transcription factor [Candidatus Eisenbacteria bacterium]